MGGGFSVTSLLGRGASFVWISVLVPMCTQMVYMYVHTSARGQSSGGLGASSSLQEGVRKNPIPENGDV